MSLRRAYLVSVLLTGVVSLAGIFWTTSFWCLSLWSGVAWGLANLWCIAKLTQTLAAGKRSWRLAGWLTVKFLGLYGLVFWSLVGLRLSVSGWLIGFTISLVGAAVSVTSSARTLFSPTRCLLSQLLFLFLWVGSFLGMGIAEASQAAQGADTPAHPPEIPNLVTLVTHWMGHGEIVEFLHTWENPIFAFLIVGIVGMLIAWGARSLSLLPNRGQMAVEAIVDGLDNLVCGVLGKEEGRRYLPFVGTLFLFILSMNLAGLVPGLKSPTSRFEMTFSLAFCVFCFVQWTGIQRRGIKGYVDHFLGEPRDLVGWLLSPLMLFIHGIGEIVKPVSLALRLFGNIMGEDTLLGVFVALGALTMAWSHLPVGLPLHLPFIFLALIFSMVQALVFTMLSMIYIYMMLPHPAPGPAQQRHGLASESGYSH